MIQTILFATDLSHHMTYLLHHVNILASQHKAKIVVLHAVEPPGHMGDAVVGAYVPSEHQRELKQQGVARIISNIKGHIVDVLEEEFMDGQQGLSHISDVRVIQGRPADVIMEQAGDCCADLLVVGSHGQGTDTPNMLGSVTTKLMQMSRTPVYMVPLLRSVVTQAKAG